MKSIIETIGEAAALEQLAEECTELAQAALKLARKKRGENPTPKTEQECIVSFMEEVADVELCKSILEGCGWWDNMIFLSTWISKRQRWLERLGDADEKSC